LLDSEAPRSLPPPDPADPPLADSLFALVESPLAEDAESGLEPDPLLFADERLLAER